MKTINTAEDVYQFVERLENACQKAGETELFNQLVDAMRLGSSALEILGAIRQTIMNNHAAIERLLGPGGKKEANEIIFFVNKAFGR